MNISYNWLKEYVDFDLSAQAVAEALTSIGLEVGGVEEVQTIKGGLEGLVVGHVLTCEPHPNSDHMHVCSVDIGSGEAQQIVCGAANVAAGQKVIVATLGTKLYDGDECFTIKKSKLRGVESLGMICAEDEIGVGTSHAGIIVLPADTPVGMLAKDYYDVKSDYVIEVDITPNRADACSHYGVARDLYAWLVRNGHATRLHRADVGRYATDNHDLEIDVEVENSEACPRYCAVSLTHCHVTESPEWLQNRLRTIGVRPINNIVDITNYIMFAYGQPLHCFDADMIAGRKIVVKTLPENTPFVTLDGESHQLGPRDLAICNAEGPMCIAGIFGGKGSGTYETTTNVVLESAYFHPTWIRKSARHHGLSTDASFRFERGIDPNGQIYALKEAALMAKELAGAQISMDIKEVHNVETVAPFKVELEYAYVHQLIGKEIPHETIREILGSLEMQITDETADGLTLLVPPYRVDVQRPCDVVEDILRIYGYNNIEIPSSIKSTLTIKGDTDFANKKENTIAEQLIGNGFNEILNNSLTKAAYYDGLQSYRPEHLVRLLNPLSADLNVMRQSLLFGGLECIGHNANRKNANLRFFEFGNCYHFHAENRTEGKTLSAYTEESHLGLWVTGKRVENSWAHADEDSSVYELKAYVCNILKRMGLDLNDFNTANGDNDIFSHSQRATDHNKNVVVEFGVVNKRLQHLFGLNNPVYYADLNWTLLTKRSKKKRTKFAEISKFPAVSRDLALLLDKSVEFADIEKVAFSAEKKLLKKVELFDVYEGQNLEPGKKSYAVNFVIQDESKTLTDKQIEKTMQNIIRSLEAKCNAKLR